MILTVAIIQYDIVWENVEANKIYLESIFNKLDDSVDIVILPEMFLTGFSMNVAKTSMEIDGEEINWIKAWSKKKNVVILGSLAIKNNDKVYNSALFVEPDGLIHQYNKRHLFRMGEENKSFTQGVERIVVNYKGIRILPLICYDLRFPVWSRNQNDYDLLIYMANWPASRQQVWDILLPARAIENQSYTIGVNRVGDGDGLLYIGGSKVVDYKGNIVADIQSQMQKVEVIQLDFNNQGIFRKKFPSFLDSDEFSIIQ